MIVPSTYGNSSLSVWLSPPSRTLLSHTRCHYTPSACKSSRTSFSPMPRTHPVSLHHTPLYPSSHPHGTAPAPTSASISSDTHSPIAPSDTAKFSPHPRTPTKIPSYGIPWISHPPYTQSTLSSPKSAKSEHGSRKTKTTGHHLPQHPSFDRHRNFSRKGPSRRPHNELSSYGPPIRSLHSLFTNTISAAAAPHLPNASAETIARTVEPMQLCFPSPRHIYHPLSTSM
jgi:hypothetical protein